MARASMFVQHSVTDPDGKIEGFPVAIAEAMFTALPVVSTRHSGIPEHVRDGAHRLPRRRGRRRRHGRRHGAAARRPGGGGRDGPGRPGLGARASVAAGLLPAAARSHGAGGRRLPPPRSGPDADARRPAAGHPLRARLPTGGLRAGGDRGRLRPDVPAARDHPVGRRQPRRHLCGDAGDGGGLFRAAPGGPQPQPDKPRADRARQPGDAARDRRLRGAERRRRRVAPGADREARRRLAGRGRAGDGGALRHAPARRRRRHRTLPAVAAADGRGGAATR